MISFDTKLQKALNILETEGGQHVPPGWQDAGHDVPLRFDGEGMVDQRDKFAVCQWEMRYIPANSDEWKHGGVFDTFDEILKYCNDHLLESMRQNDIHGFQFFPNDDEIKGMYETDVVIDPDKTWREEQITPYHDVGHTVPLDPGAGSTQYQPGQSVYPWDGVVDKYGNFAVWHWEIRELKPDGSASYGGEINHLDELPSVVEDLVNGMRSNYIHGLTIEPAHAMHANKPSPQHIDLDDDHADLHDE